MEFGIGQHSNLTTQQTGWINELSEELNSFLNERNFGDGLAELVIGLIVVKPEFEAFAKPKRPRYFPGERSFTTEGITINTLNCAEIDVKIDFQDAIKLERLELLQLLSERIIEQLPSLTRLSKLKDFDFGAFELEITKFLRSKNYLKN
ncbi:hypothetical protein [Marinoscillum sp.]|uniref:hypothetical protein n=1 Tax=Marinoscillum sp. TaxID=2024838 RepID=UPI003BACEFA3